MALHPQFPTSPYAQLLPDHRWFPAAGELRTTAYEKHLPPLVAKVRQEVHAWRIKGYASAPPTSVALLRHWFETKHLNENADDSRSEFRYYFAQREAIETVIWLHEVRAARDKYDLLRFDASGAVLIIHTKHNGEISEAASSKNKEELDLLRKQSNQVDSRQSPYKAIVSVLMLDAEIHHSIALDGAGVADYRSVVACFARQFLNDLRLVGGYEVSCCLRRLHLRLTRHVTAWTHRTCCPPRRSEAEPR
jgi:hypothetical protein